MEESGKSQLVQQGRKPARRLRTSRLPAARVWSLTSTMFRISRLPTSALANASRCRRLATASSQLPSQSHGHLPTSQSPITPKLQFFNSVMEDGKQIPTYRVLDGTGKVIEGAQLPEVRFVEFIALARC